MAKIVVEDRIYKVVSQVFGVAVGEINEEATLNAVEKLEALKPQHALGIGCDLADESSLRQSVQNAISS